MRGVSVEGWRRGMGGGREVRKVDSAAQCYNLHDPLVHYNMPLSLQEMGKVVSKIGKVGKSLQLAIYRQGKN